MISGRVSKSTSKSITPTASRKKGVKLETGGTIKDEPVDSEDGVEDIMELDSTDERFSLSSFAGDIEG